MKYTIEQLNKFIRTHEITSEIVMDVVNDINTIIDEKNDLENNSTLLVTLAQLTHTNVIKNCIFEVVSVVDRYKNVVKLPSSLINVYYALVYIYFRIGFAPKVVEYGLQFLDINETNYLRKAMVLNYMAIVLKDFGFYDKALEYIDEYYEEIRHVDNYDPVFLSIINDNNHCYILTDLKRFDEAIEYSNHLNRIITENIDKTNIKDFLPSAELTRLYVDSFVYDENDISNRYIAVMNKMRIEGKVNNIFQSIKPHIRFFNILYKNGHGEEVIKIGKEILESTNYTGDFCELFKLLLDLSQEYNGYFTSDELKLLQNNYMKELSLINQNHQSILKLMIKEQYRIYNIDKQYDKIKMKYEVDALTNALNRPSLELNGQNYINNNKHGSIIFLDLDNLKLINDTYGHYYGDLALKEFVLKIKEVSQDCINFYRYAGDEFVIITPFNKEETEKYISDIKNEFAISSKLNNIEVNIYFSEGTVYYSPNYNNLEDLIAKADCLMYECKRTHKNIRK